MNKIKMISRRFLLLTLWLTLFLHCDRPNVTIVIHGVDEGNILIDSKPIAEYVHSKVTSSKEEVMLYLDIPEGEHLFSIYFYDSTKIDTLVSVSQEEYYGVDFKTKYIDGF